MKKPEKIMVRSSLELRRRLKGRVHLGGQRGGDGSTLKKLKPEEVPSEDKGTGDTRIRDRFARG